MLKMKSEEMALVMGVNFKCSNGWLQKFKTETEFYMTISQQRR
jgi:hypothetical protein